MVVSSPALSDMADSTNRHQGALEDRYVFWLVARSTRGRKASSLLPTSHFLSILFDSTSLTLAATHHAILAEQGNGLASDRRRLRGGLAAGEDEGYTIRRRCGMAAAVRRHAACTFWTRGQQAPGAL